MKPGSEYPLIGFLMSDLFMTICISSSNVSSLGTYLVGLQADSKIKAKIKKEIIPDKIVFLFEIFFSKFCTKSVTQIY